MSDKQTLAPLLVLKTSSQLQSQQVNVNVFYCAAIGMQQKGQPSPPTVSPTAQHPLPWRSFLLLHGHVSIVKRYLKKEH